MKVSSFRVFTLAGWLTLAAFSLTGCGKIKSVLARKPGQPTPSPAPASTSSGPTSVAAASPGAAASPTANVAPAPTPARPAVPAVNRSAGVMVLCYHRLEEHPRARDPLAMTPGEFEREMQAIKDAGFSVIGMQDFLAWRRGDKDIPPKSCVITIDDGFVSGYDTAWPILKKFSYPFTMFVYVNYIGSGGKSISWDQLAEMRDAGVDIQSHSYSHGNLLNPNDRIAVDKRTFGMIQKDVQDLGADGWLKKVITESKNVLERQLGIKVNAIAYPFGKYNQRVREIVKDAGYEAGFTVYGQRISHSTPAFDIIGRYALEEAKPKTFQDAISMVGGGSGGGPAALPEVAQRASASMVTQPMDGETISNPKPLIKANLATMGDVDPKSVSMRISGIGPVPAKYDPASKNVSFQIAQPLKEPSYRVILSATANGKRSETSWAFNFDAKAAPAAPATRSR